MRFVRSKNRITGKRFNGISKLFKPFGKNVPLKKDLEVIDDKHIAIFKQSGDGPVLGVEEPEWSIPLRAINGTFDDDDELDVSTKDRQYIIAHGKDEYGIPMESWDKSDLRIPKLDLEHSVIIDPGVFRRFEKTKSDHKELLVLVNGRDANGQEVLHLMVGGFTQTNGKDVFHCDCYETIPFKAYGRNVTDIIPWSYARHLANVDVPITLEFDSNYPIRASWTTDVDSMYLVAPRVEVNDRGEHYTHPEISDFIREQGGTCGGP